MAKKTKDIPLHKSQLPGYGAEVKCARTLHEGMKAAHRDDHYIFLLQQQGMLSLEIDFSGLQFDGPALCFITPGQVHRYLDLQGHQGWFLFADPALIPGRYREILDTYQHVRQSTALDPADVLFAGLPVLEQLLSSRPDSLNQTIVTSQVSVLAGIIASRIIQTPGSELTFNSQPYHLTTQFKQLIKQHYKVTKQVQQYAAMLNITPLYLNEIIRAVTGFSASHWIQQEVLLEARRLLYYTGLDVKQIAYGLGYEDHAYFSRFFKKNVGITAIEFRKKYHDLSNNDR